MQHCRLCLFVGLLVVKFLQPSVMDKIPNLPNKCCFTYYGRRIPISKIDSYKDTIGCSKPGIIFVTKKGYRICVDPQLSWVKSAMKAFDDNFLQDRCFGCGLYTGVKMSPDPIPTGHSTTRLGWFHSVSDSQRQSDLTSFKSDGNTNEYGSTETDQMYRRSTGLYNGRTGPLTTNQQLKDSASHVNTVSVKENLDHQMVTVFCLGNQFGQQQ